MKIFRKRAKTSHPNTKRREKLRMLVTRTHVEYSWRTCTSHIPSRLGRISTHEIRNKIIFSFYFASKANRGLRSFANRFNRAWNGRPFHFLAEIWKSHWRGKHSFVFWFFIFFLCWYILVMPLFHSSRRLGT